MNPFIYMLSGLGTDIGNVIGSFANDLRASRSRPYRETKGRRHASRKSRNNRRKAKRRAQ